MTLTFLTMSAQKADTFSLKGEILEILDQPGTSTIKIICKPDWILLNINDSEGYKLGDKVMVDGHFTVKGLYKIDLEESKSQK